MLNDYWVQDNSAAVNTYVRTKMSTFPAVLLPRAQDIQALRLPRLHRVLDVSPTLKVWSNTTLVTRLAQAKQMLLGKTRLDAGTRWVKVGNSIYIPQYPKSLCPFDFPKAVVRDLRQIYAHPSGQQLLDSINTPRVGQDKKLFILFADGFVDRAMCDRLFTGPGEWNLAANAPGQPASYVWVQYNPQLFGLPKITGYFDDDPSFANGAWGAPAHKPPDVSLFHELVHADDFLRGVFCETTATRGTKQVKISEMRCVGLDEFDRPEIYSENTYRAERGVTRRPYYTESDELAAIERFQTRTSKFWHPIRYGKEKQGHADLMQKVGRESVSKHLLSDYLAFASVRDNIRSGKVSKLL